MKYYNKITPLLLALALLLSACNEQSDSIRITSSNPDTKTDVTPDTEPEDTVLPYYSEWSEFGASSSKVIKIGVKTIIRKNI